MNEYLKLIKNNQMRYFPLNYFLLRIVPESKKRKNKPLKSDHLHNIISKTSKQISNVIDNKLEIKLTINQKDLLPLTQFYNPTKFYVFYIVCQLYIR
jgi:hypothetical protein